MAYTILDAHPSFWCALPQVVHTQNGAHLTPWCAPRNLAPAINLGTDLNRGIDQEIWPGP